MNAPDPIAPTDGPSDHRADQELLARIQSGDTSACTECIERHAPGVYRLALRLVRDEAEAEDVMQETFLSAFKGIQKFEGRSALGTWLYRIAYNAALMRLRRHEPPTVSVDDPVLLANGSELPRQLFDWCCLPEREFETDEAQSELEQAVRALPEKLRAVFVLRELEGLSTEETAEALDLTPEAVKTRLHRARLWLRERLSDYFTGRAQDLEENRYGA
jgi:RNA polymerase sigma-70 factor (ECF subfamily)